MCSRIFVMGPSIKYVRSQGEGEGVKPKAYVLYKIDLFPYSKSVQEGGGSKNTVIGAYVLYGWPRCVIYGLQVCVPLFLDPYRKHSSIRNCRKGVINIIPRVSTI